MSNSIIKSTSPHANRSDEERNAHIEQIAQLRRRSWSVDMIATKLGISIKTVENDIAYIRSKIHERGELDIKVLRDEIDEQYAYIQQQAQEEYEKSKEEVPVYDKDGQVIGSRTQLGANEYLRTKVNVLKDRRELHGVDRPAAKEEVKRDQAIDVISMLIPILKKGLKDSPVVVNAIKVVDSDKDSNESNDPDSTPSNNDISSKINNTSNDATSTKSKSKSSTKSTPTLGTIVPKKRTKKAPTRTTPRGKSRSKKT